jgi:hypothetical protein
MHTRRRGRLPLSLWIACRHGCDVVADAAVVADGAVAVDPVTLVVAVVAAAGLVVGVAPAAVLATVRMVVLGSINWHY